MVIITHDDVLKAKERYYELVWANDLIKKIDNQSNVVNGTCFSEIVNEYDNFRVKSEREILNEAFKCVSLVNSVDSIYVYLGSYTDNIVDLNGNMQMVCEGDYRTRYKRYKNLDNCNNIYVPISEALAFEKGHNIKRFKNINNINPVLLFERYRYFYLNQLIVFDIPYLEKKRYIKRKL